MDSITSRATNDATIQDLKRASNPIELEGVGKCYRIYANPQDRFKQALRDRFASWMGAQTRPPLFREHWALRDVSFAIGPGEAVGILGRNGAGKSTLLQIIAGTLTPSTGAVQTSGRITALLELGSGFNPEFTGRENVFHNAQILGLSRAQAEEKLDDILSFADIGDFVEQPVKTYSSGMVMRLAFAVQTAVEPQVLIVDEALSVGDMFFQAKCMARINRLVDAGVALLFVSHDIGSVRQLCHRAVLLDGGVVREIGTAASVSDHYVRLQLEDRNQTEKKQSSKHVGGDNRINSSGTLRDESSNTQVNETEQILTEREQALKNILFERGREAFNQRAMFNRMGNGDARIVNVTMFRGDMPTTDFEFGENILIRVVVIVNKTLKNLNVSLKIRTLQGSDIVFFDTRLQDEMNRVYQQGLTYCFDWYIQIPLMHGNYGLGCGLSHPPSKPGEDWNFVDMVPHAYEFRVAARSEGMIDSFVALPAKLIIQAGNVSKD
jgi:lipopolysaccharide transport system ATP-binding protein